MVQRMTRLRRRTPSNKGGEHGRLWRVVEGAVADAVINHPDYFQENRERTAIVSITKRVVGQVLQSFAMGARGGASR